ncbi:MAG: hypothetical protein R3245_08105 [Kiloniellales bacterium]|nr:hypothetical protein [Kiloniellales bacterium]
MRGQSNKMLRFTFVAVALALIFGFSKAGVLPPIIQGEGEWRWWAGYGLGGVVAGLLAFEGWRMMK